MRPCAWLARDSGLLRQREPRKRLARFDHFDAASAEMATRGRGDAREHANCCAEVVRTRDTRRTRHRIPPRPSRPPRSTRALFDKSRATTRRLRAGTKRRAGSAPRLTSPRPRLASPPLLSSRCCAASRVPARTFPGIPRRAATPRATWWRAEPLLGAHVPSRLPRTPDAPSPSGRRPPRRRRRRTRRRRGFLLRLRRRGPARPREATPPSTPTRRSTVDSADAVFEPEPERERRRSVGSADAAEPARRSYSNDPDHLRLGILPGSIPKHRGGVRTGDVHEGRGRGSFSSSSP